MRVCVLSHFSCVQLFMTLWTCQVPLSRDSPSKNTGMGCHALLQGWLVSVAVSLLIPCANAKS